MNPVACSVFSFFAMRIPIGLGGMSLSRLAQLILGDFVLGFADLSPT
jgi:hypothetical protein